MCREWADGVEARGQATQYKLESELSGYKTNLIKESIRMGHHELADFFFARGDTQVRPLGSLIDSYSNQPYAAAVMGLPAAEPCLQKTSCFIQVWHCMQTLIDTMQTPRVNACMICGFCVCRSRRSRAMCAHETTAPRQSMSSTCVCLSSDAQWSWATLCMSTRMWPRGSSRLRQLRILSSPQSSKLPAGLPPLTTKSTK